MTMPSALAEMGDHRFVSLTTFRRAGTPVASPVWIAQDGGALVVTTIAQSGKVKRLRRDPRVELRPCSRRGVVADGAPSVSAVATVEAPQPAPAVDALKRKYGLEYRIITTVERVLRRGTWERVILRITAG